MAIGHFGREKDVSVMSDYDAYIGLDVHNISVAVAEAGSAGSTNCISNTRLWEAGCCNGF
ncbi:hypothetical protein [Sinorhizobium prairiense]|uniref:hypothetical protein n=1 Tax=unclassified Sinorhizobium TaxID=2613772 RepID=UPI0023D86CD7|nr:MULTISPECIES: hypothetical protein [unclassified Sinorhizobium]WEJ08791.1 hypothetical protein N0Q90_00280 [Sinorhizobium sp. M103]WEJ14151.1 hypothetical protein N0Q91_02390 [Sinorhizobium sp. K101]WEJ35748.1 hypothetical protein N0R80_02415 [Sinorhizobium sp. C101]